MPWSKSSVGCKRYLQDAWTYVKRGPNDPNWAAWMWSTPSVWICNCKPPPSVTRHLPWTATSAASQLSVAHQGRDSWRYCALDSQRHFKFVYNSPLLSFSRVSAGPCKCISHGGQGLVNVFLGLRDAKTILGHFILALFLVTRR